MNSIERGPQLTWETRALTRLKVVGGVALIAITLSLIGLAIWGAKLSLPAVFHYAFSCTTINGQAFMLMAACVVTVTEGMVAFCAVYFPAMGAYRLLEDARKELRKESLMDRTSDRIRDLKKESKIDNL